MTRDELQNEITALGKRASGSGHYFIGACLMFVASAMSSGDDVQLAEMLLARHMAQQATKRH